MGRPITEFRGVLPALITPFDESGEVALELLRRFVEHLLPKVDGFFVCGSYGSGPIMRLDQRQRVAEVVCETVAGRKPVIVHVGLADTGSTIELAKHAASVGADAVASLTPYYYLNNADIVSLHFRRLIESSALPVVLYNNPKYTNFCITPEQIAELAGVGLAGFKDSSTNIQLFYDCVSAVGDRPFSFLVGSQTVLLPGLVGGGHGCVSGLSNLFPGIVNRIFEEAATGRMSAALALQRRANQLRKLTGAGIPIPFYHSALRHKGVDIGVPRAPLRSVSSEEHERIGRALKEFGELS